MIKSLLFLFVGILIFGFGYSVGVSTSKTKPEISKTSLPKLEVNDIRELSKYDANSEEISFHCYAPDSKFFQGNEPPNSPEVAQIVSRLSKNKLSYSQICISDLGFVVTDSSGAVSLYKFEGEKINIVTPIFKGYEHVELWKWLSNGDIIYSVHDGEDFYKVYVFKDYGDSVLIEYCHLEMNNPEASFSCTENREEGSKYMDPNVFVEYRTY